MFHVEICLNDNVKLLIQLIICKEILLLQFNYTWG
jgi:hypothetical protein